MSNRLVDHLDLRVRDPAAARSFYDPLLRAFSMRGRVQADGTVVYVRIIDHHILEAVALIADPAHCPNASRVAFAAELPSDVDRVAAVAQAAGARDFEPPALCPEIGPNYYTAFFADPDGNRLEIVAR
ncbi:MAG: VOC family protein [Vulcanimicrobiaceae bacterium]